MQHLIVTIKGFFVGIALIIPGLSGGNLAVYLGIYEKLLHAIGHVFSEFVDSMKFLIPLFVGMAISIVGLANLLGYLIDVNSFVILLFFMGLIAGGIKDIYQAARQDETDVKPSSIITGVISFALILLLIVFGKLSNSTGISTIDISVWNIVLLFFLGMAASMTMIVPGVSGSALLIVLGYYTAIVTNVVGEILDFSQFSYNIQVIIPFALGAAIGIILFSKVIESALKRFTQQTYFAILGFVGGSIIAIFFEIKDPSTGMTHDLQDPIYNNLISFLGDNIISLLGAIVLFVLGFVVSRRLTQMDFKSN